MENRPLALGRMTGTVVVTSLARVQSVAAEWTLRGTRSCVGLSWNVAQQAWLAAGYERDRRDQGVYVWDVERGSSKTPVCGVGAAGEGCAALCWENNSNSGSNNNLAVGLASKFLRMYDLRASSSLAQQSVLAHEKEVMGVKFSPTRKHQLLTFGGEVVKIWDVRNLRSGVPIMTFNASGGEGGGEGGLGTALLVDAQWSPGGSYVAGIEGGDKVNIWKIDGGGGGGITIGNDEEAPADVEEKEDEEEVVVVDGSDAASAGTTDAMITTTAATSNTTSALSTSNSTNTTNTTTTNTDGDKDERDNNGDIDGDAFPAPPAPAPPLSQEQQHLYRHHHRYYHSRPISSFAWHPSESSNQIVVVSPPPTITLDFLRVCQDVPFAWGGSGGVGGGYLTYFAAAPPAALAAAPVSPFDLTWIMKQRAEAGYGLSSPQKNAELVATTELTLLWAWMACMQQEPKLKYQGAISLLTQQQQEASSSVTHAPILLPIYTSSARSAVLDIICTAVPDVSRSAVIQMCSGHQDTAVTLLLNAPGLESVAIALAGYTAGSSSTIWSKAALALSAGGALSALLRVLTCIDVQQVVQNVLNDAIIPLWDRLVIACIFLPDSLLVAFCTQSAQMRTAKGLLDAIVLTGLGRQGGGLLLLQAYVDRTHDVQTAALVASAVVPSRFRDAQAERWIECYRTLLDRWSMWESRARFDIERRHFVEEASSEAIGGVPRLGANSGSAPSQIYIRCNNCDQSLSLSMMVPSKLALRAALSRVAASRVKACPSPKCREALPRCVLCLLPMECAAPLASGMAEASTQDSSVLQDSFFTFCTLCRHGGHPDHMLDWFSKHTQCPVSECPCNCGL